MAHEVNKMLFPNFDDIDVGALRPELKSKHTENVFQWILLDYIFIAFTWNCNCFLF